MKICYHPDAVTETIDAPARVRYERRIAGPGKGMLRRVRTEPYRFLERRCPDCRARAVKLVSDLSLRYRVDLAPSLIPDPVDDLGLEPGTYGWAEWAP